MSENSGFSFSDTSVAGAYANVLVPILFEPWAKALIEDYGPWENRNVLDLATGTGIVAHLLSQEVGIAGSVVGMDMNKEMLDIAASDGDARPNLSFKACPAENLDSSSDVFDYVVCQQGFQFFADKTTAAKEIRRVLREGGSAIVSVWRPISECEFFAAICDALRAIEESEIAELMRAPFDFMPRPEMIDAFESAGFRSVDVQRNERDLAMSGGTHQAIQAAYATPIGPKLRALTEPAQAKLLEELVSRLERLSNDGTTMGRMAADVVIASK